MQSPNSSDPFDSGHVDLATYIDHTLLRADAVPLEIETLCREAKQFGFKAVCVGSGYVAMASQMLNGSSVFVCSVVGFPLGTMTSESKAFETSSAIRAGAREIDTVLNLGRAKSGDWQYCEDDVAAVVGAAKGAAGNVPVKVILETGLLTPEEIARACQISARAGAAWVKTSTGMLGARGATVDDVLLMRKNISTEMQIKASGGIKSVAQARELLRAGARRLGTSSGVALVTTKSSQQKIETGGY